jgi:hypothetical protein
VKFRLKLAGLHLLSSLGVLTLVLGVLYLGWYRWPGWYLTNALRVVPILVLVDVALGPLLTLLVANPRKSRRELTRDIGIIVAMQLLALGFGASTLWRGRPLYYAFSEDRLQLVQASDLDPSEIGLARTQNPQLAPYWYSRPRWVWAPLPGDPALREQIVDSAVGGGDDVIQMPRYFQAWDKGLPELRAHLLTVDKQSDGWFFRKKPALKQQLQRKGFAPDAPVTLLMTGQAEAPLLVVFDPEKLQIRAYLRADFPIPVTGKKHSLKRP